MKGFILILILFCLGACKGSSTSTTSDSLDTSIYGHDWSYSNLIRHASAGITTGSSYVLVFNQSSGNAVLTINSSSTITYTLTTTGSNTFDAVSSANGTTTHWTYTLNDTARTLNLCLDSSSCVNFTR